MSSNYCSNIDARATINSSHTIFLKQKASFVKPMQLWHDQDKLRCSRPTCSVKKIQSALHLGWLCQVLVIPRIQDQSQKKQLFRQNKRTETNYSPRLAIAATFPRSAACWYLQKKYILNIKKTKLSLIRKFVTQTNRLAARSSWGGFAVSR